MIQKAIVESIENDYQVKVRIPKYDKMSSDGFSYDELSTSIICSSPGTLVNYNKGDVVLVGFENDEISKPVVLGLLYTNNNFGNSIKFPALSDTIDSMSSSLDKLENLHSYIFIRYSNDGGNTFTSLYDYSDETYDDTTKTYSASNIVIDPTSSFIAWNITDDSNLNALDNFYIETTLTVPNSEDEDNPITVSTTDKTIEIPLTLKNIEGITLSYSLICIYGNKEDYNIALYTDKNDLGTTEGDYIGFYYSNTQYPSLNPAEYSWASIKIRIQKFIDEAFNNLLSRVQTNERYLYGKAEEDSTNTNLGIEAALEVQQNALNISYKPQIILSQSSNIKLDTEQNYLFFNNLVLEAASNGHLRIVTR